MARRRPRQGGKPLKLGDEATVARLLDAIRGGTPMMHAAVYAGIGVRTLYDTLERGELADEKVQVGERLTLAEAQSRDVWRKVTEARSQVAVRNVALVQRVAQGGTLVRERTLPNGVVEREYAQPDWRAAKFLLQSSFRGEFVDSQHAAVEVSGPGGGPVRVEPSQTLVALAASVRETLAEADDAEFGDVVDGEVVEALEDGQAASNGHARLNGHLNGYAPGPNGTSNGNGTH